MLSISRITIIIPILLVGVLFFTKSYNYKVNAIAIANKNIDIQKVMDYQMPHVISRYCKDYNVSLNDAKIHEIELKRFLILAGANDEPVDMFSTEVDNLWHTFLLFTRDYQKFCNDMFGKFLHHDPVIEDL